MPLTVITIKNPPNSLRGDLTKWMQEIATGVYVGNFNTKVRQELWKRVVESVGIGEATLSYAYRNEIGYNFETYNTERSVVDFDGIPLVMLRNKEISRDETQSEEYKTGFSNASKFHKAKLFSKQRDFDISFKNQDVLNQYVIIDIETDGLDFNKNSIIEIGAIKVKGNQIEEFNYLVEYNKLLPENIIDLTGITPNLLKEDGKPINEILVNFLEFIENLDIIGYGVDFDLRFINKALDNFGMPKINNKTHDLIKHVKKEKKFAKNYKLETILKEYDIDEKVPHRALLDSKLIYRLYNKIQK